VLGEPVGDIRPRDPFSESLNTIQGKYQLTQSGGAFSPFQLNGALFQISADLVEISFSLLPERLRNVVFVIGFEGFLEYPNGLEFYF